MFSRMKLQADQRAAYRRHCAYLNLYRTERVPLYGEDLIRAVRTNLLPILTCLYLCHPIHVLSHVGIGEESS